MNKQKLSLLLTVLLLTLTLLLSCGALEYSYNEDNASSKTEDGALKWSCDIRYPFFRSGKISDKLNASLDTILREYQANAMSYQAEADEMRALGSIAPYEFDLDAEVLLSDEKYISIRFTDYTYLGGAHGSTAVCGAIYDAESGERLLPEDILGVSGIELMTVVSEELTAMIEASPEEFYPDALELIETVLFGGISCYIEGNELVFPIQEYEIAPYAAGVQYVRIALDSQS